MKFFSALTILIANPIKFLGEGGNIIINETGIGS